MAKPFTTTISDGIAEMILEQPPVNAFNCQGWLSIANEISHLGNNQEVRVIVIGASGKGFCAGVDIKELAEDPSLIVEVNRGNYETFEAIHRNSKPVILALHGYVLGGGIGMAGASDILVASECARFGLPEIDRGAMGGGAHLQRMFSVQKVRYMYFTGEFIDAHEAYRLGAVERVVARDKLMSTARDIATKIAAKSPQMVSLAKESLNGIEDGCLEDKYRWEQGFTLQAYTTNDSTESREAFVDKRDAKFPGQS